MDPEVKRIHDLIENVDIFTPLKNIDMSKTAVDRGVFSVERNKYGKRTFFLAKYETIFEIIHSGYTYEESLYEVIPENHPCHLYFDIEYLFEEHPEFDGEKILKDLIDMVDEKLFLTFGQDDYKVLDLYATTTTKFSHHLIFNSDEFCFKNNKHVGMFVSNEILTDEIMKCVVDPAVYTKNRNFRCLWSTKCGKGNPLKIQGVSLKDKNRARQVFFETMITRVGSNPHLIGYPEEEVAQVTPYYGIDFMKTTQLVDVNGMSIEEFAIKSFAPLGSIKTARYSPQYDTLTFLIQGSRFCRHIGREHKSNSIYLVCRLMSGTIVQKCFDPDCRGFESEPLRIPDEILNQVRAIYNDSAQTQQQEQIQPKKESIGSSYSYIDSDDDIFDEIYLE